MADCVWEPWMVIGKGQPVMTLNISEPPCKCCKHFRPRVKTDANGVFAGVVICTAPEMYSDFSCFKLDQGPQDKAPKVV